ncbi:MAG TPA: hypothetical protein PLQ76_08085, partial [bacterium]|nr:hypothetical protein [bacterium]
WKEPGYSMIEVLGADNSGIDMASKQIKKKPGTQVVFGYKDKKDIYGKFPKVGDPVLDKQLSKRIFHMSVTALEGSRPEVGYYQNIKTITAMFAKIISKGKLSLQNAPVELKRDFNYDPEAKKLSFSSAKTPKAFYKLTFLPSNTNETGGVTKLVIIVNPDTYMPAQIEEYEGAQLVVIMSIADLKTNAGVNDDLWESYFKGAVIFSGENQTGGKSK